jgi:glucans biosynthesis protein
MLQPGKRSQPPQGDRWARAILFVASVVLFAPSVWAFDLDDVTEKARTLAAEAFEDPRGKVPEWLLEISYDQWRDIRFRADAALWSDRKAPFQVQFFHPGLYYDRVVRINVVEGDGVRPVQFSPSQFDYGKNEFNSRVPQDLGYAGFRVHYPIKTRDYFDEVIVFLGASYFRALGKDEVFGMSARGLGIDTAEPRGEEFPYFREFWLVSPGPAARELSLYALLDGPRVTGAYHFVVYPGDETLVDVEARLFLREEVTKLGIAPMTSMFQFGENTMRCFNDFRPEIHDSDGVLLQTSSGEWIWRPLDNPASLHVSSFEMKNPKGFGLLQRDRDFANYQDLETNAERRPSVWIEPKGDWGPGRVEIVEIPTDSDTNDNVVTYWIPEKRPAPGEAVSYSYRQFWFGDDTRRPPGGRVVATRRGLGSEEDVVRFVVDFAGGKLQKIPADKVLRGVITVVGGETAAELIGQHVVKNPATGGWRLAFQIKPTDNEAVELRAFLDLGGEALTETWSYVLLP